MKKASNTRKKAPGIRKCLTGVNGLDDITNGGLPAGRPTLVCGGAGSGKTLLAMEFIMRGARDFGEPGVFMAFEETAKELADNVSSLGFDLNGLVDRGIVAVDYVYIERSEFLETGEYDLEGLFIRLGSMIDSIGAKRVALDSIETLFAGIPNPAIVRSELRRLFRWLKEKGVTAVITGEQGENTLTRHGLEEYVSDCVIFLDHRVINQIGTRRLRIVKYRGSRHGTNEYPTMIDENGLSIIPITSLGLTHAATNARISTGIKRMDAMFGGKGYFRGSSILISGTAGSGKSSIAVAFADGVCRRGERCLYYSFEESPDQIIRNMRSIGYELGGHVRKGRLLIHSIRPTLYGLENHLVELHNLVEKYNPRALVIDPISNLVSVGNKIDTSIMLTRVVDFLKHRQITTVFTSLTNVDLAPEQSEAGISSLMDTWLLLRMVEDDNERNRVMYILKSRGMAHSNRMNEFVLSDSGIEIVDMNSGSARVKTAPGRSAGKKPGRKGRQTEGA